MHSIGRVTIIAWIDAQSAAQEENVIRHAIFAAINVTMANRAIIGRTDVLHLQIGIKAIIIVERQSRAANEVGVSAGVAMRGGCARL